LQKYDDGTRKSALGFVDGLYAGGSTNIDGALGTALGMIQDKKRPSYVLFLTDGLPTVGEMNEAKIVANAKQKNTHHARVITFGVGYDVNSRLLDRLGRELFGNSEYVRPDENIENAVSKLYSKMSAPVMTDVAVKIEVDSPTSSTSSVTSRVYPKEVYDLFSGEQLVQVGRYKQFGDAKVTITGKVSGEEKKFDFPAKLVEHSNDQSYAFVEKLWALRRVGEIIDELDLHGKNDELVKELVELATKHGILTPYTSFLADETSTVRELADVTGNAARAGVALERLAQVDGRSGFYQRADKKSFREAEQVPAAPAPLALEGAAEPRPYGLPARGRGGVASGGASAASASPANAPASNSYRDLDTGRIVVADAVQNVGNETLYRRGKLWVAANAKDVDPEKEQGKIKKVERFSDAYFKLVDENTPAENALLARQQAGEQLLVRLRGQVYQIE
jgi:Ca-activated chloride channel family protein